MRSVKIWPYLLLVVFLLALFSLPQAVQGRIHAFAVSFASIPWEEEAHEKQQTEFFMLEQENRLLKKEVGELKRQLAHETWIARQIEWLKEIRGRDVHDPSWQEFFSRRAKQLSARLEMHMLGIPAKVVYRDPNFWSSYIWIDVGSADNGKLGVTVVSKNSPVVVKNQLVGVVEEVEKYRSKVRLITDIQLVPAVRAVRGEQSAREFLQMTDQLLEILHAKLGLYGSSQEEHQAIYAIEKLKATTRQAWGDQYLAKGELCGSSTPLWRSRDPVLKGMGFNYDFADEEGPARDLRTGQVDNSSDPSLLSLLQPGDLLITSGQDGIFPAGIEVAIVKKVHLLREGASSYELEAIPVVSNLGDLSEVWVLPSIAQK